MMSGPWHFKIKTSAALLSACILACVGNPASAHPQPPPENAASGKTANAASSPIALHYKRISITPSGFVAVETVYRQKAVDADVPTPLRSIPFNGASAASQSEFYGSARQSRFSLLAEGKTGAVALRGYVETDLLGVSSGSNPPNDYVLRKRVVWGQAVLKNGFTFQGGQMWSLATERAHGLSNFSRDVKTPLTIDSNYVPGFVWARQYGFALLMNGNRVSYGISLENAHTVTGGSACPAGSCLLGSSGNYNLCPDLVGKLALDPAWGHYEAFALARFPHYRYYPNYALGGTAGAADSVSNALPTGGFGGSLRAPVFGRHGNFGLSGLYGWGVGRYGDTGLADVTFDSTGSMKALTNASALSTVELHPTSHLVLYANFGEDFAGRLAHLAAGPSSGYGLLNADNSGCDVQSSTSSTGAPANCTGDNKFVQETTAGFWFNLGKGRTGSIRFGGQYAYINRAIWGGAATPQANATENQFYTSFRYYLP